MYKKPSSCFVHTLSKKKKHNIFAFFIRHLSKWLYWVGESAKLFSGVRKIRILKLRGSVHRGLRIQQEVFLGDPPCTGVNRNHWEAHLESPAIHDVVDCVRDLKTWCGFNCLRTECAMQNYERGNHLHAHTLQRLHKPVSVFTIPYLLTCWRWSHKSVYTVVENAKVFRYD